MKDAEYILYCWHILTTSSLLRAGESNLGVLFNISCLITTNLVTRTDKIEIPSKLAGLLFLYQMTSHQHQQ